VHPIDAIFPLQRPRQPATVPFHLIFSVRQHIAYMLSVLLCYRPSISLSVRPSVRPSHGWIIQKQFKLWWWNFHSAVSPSL